MDKQKEVGIVYDDELDTEWRYNGQIGTEYANHRQGISYQIDLEILEIATMSKPEGRMLISILEHYHARQLFG